MSESKTNGLRFRAVEVRHEHGYTVAFPQLPGSFAEGRTLEEARGNARAALKEYLEGVAREYGQDGEKALLESGSNGSA